MAQLALPPGPHFGYSLRSWSFFSNPKSFYAWLRRRYGEVVTFPTASAPLVLALTAEGACQVLTKNPAAYDAFHKKAFTGLTGAGSLWVSDGVRHRRERQLLAPSFSARCVRQYGRTIQEIARLHTDAWHLGQPMRAYDAMLDISLNVILYAVFGTTRGGLMEEGRRTVKTLMRHFGPLISAFPALQTRLFLPWLRYDRAKREFSIFVARCLADRQAQLNESQDVLAVMLAARQENEPSLTDNEIRDELITILLAGHETTAVALSWALYELALHPVALNLLRDELVVLGPDPSPELVVKQPFLGAVCNETLRLHTILTEIGRISQAPSELLSYRLPAGIGLGVGIGAIHQDPILYPKPDQFRPERFIERKYGAFEFLPFGGGHRRCLGAHLSDYEMRIVLALIVTRWDFEVIRRDCDIRHNIGTGPKHGVQIRLTRRRKITSSVLSTTHATSAPPGEPVRGSASGQQFTPWALA
jgi:cytochrome P450 family 110